MHYFLYRYILQCIACNVYASVVLQAPAILTTPTLYVCENYAHTFLILNLFIYIKNPNKCPRFTTCAILLSRC